VESSEGAPENGVRHWEQCATLCVTSFFGFPLVGSGHVFVTTFRTFVTFPAGTKPDPIRHVN
jgi:hypothetical protein